MNHSTVYLYRRIAAAVDQKLTVTRQQLGQFLLQICDRKRHAVLVADKKHFLRILIHDNRPNGITKGSIDFVPFAH